LCVRGGLAGRRRGHGEGSLGRNVRGARPAWRRCNFGTNKEERQGRASRLQADGEEGGATHRAAGPSTWGGAGPRENGVYGSAPILKVTSRWSSSPCWPLECWEQAGAG
jgi:hypothetical protein